METWCNFNFIQKKHLTFYKIHTQGSGSNLWTSVLSPNMKHKDGCNEEEWHDQNWNGPTAIQNQNPRISYKNPNKWHIMVVAPSFLQLVIPCQEGSQNLKLFVEQGPRWGVKEAHLHFDTRRVVRVESPHASRGSGRSGTSGCCRGCGCLPLTNSTAAASSRTRGPTCPFRWFPTSTYRCSTCWSRLDIKTNQKRKRMFNWLQLFLNPSKR